jgi:hypothetical protein
MYKPIAMNCAPAATGVLHGCGDPEGEAEGTGVPGDGVAPLKAGVGVAFG